MIYWGGGLLYSESGVAWKTRPESWCATQLAAVRSRLDASANATTIKRNAPATPNPPQLRLNARW